MPNERRLARAGRTTPRRQPVRWTRPPWARCDTGRVPAPRESGSNAPGDPRCWPRVGWGARTPLHSSVDFSSATDRGSTGYDLTRGWHRSGLRKILRSSFKNIPIRHVADDAGKHEPRGFGYSVRNDVV